jgi:hypothetical protein
VTDRHRVRQILVVVAFVLGSLVFTSPWAHAQTSDTEPATTAVIPPGETAPDGGPLLVPGEPETASSSVADDAANADNTGTVVALVISGLLLVALLLALLTYWFWRNTRPVKPTDRAPKEDKVVVNG